MAELTCPNCGGPFVDGQCTSCGLRGTFAEATNPLTDSVLDGLLFNVRVISREMTANEFRQLTGVFGPSASDPNGILFKPGEAALVARYFHAHGILCRWISFRSTPPIAESVVFAISPTGLDRGLHAARKVAGKLRAVITVHEPRLDS